MIPHTASERRQRKYREAGTLNVSEIQQDAGAQSTGGAEIATAKPYGFHLHAKTTGRFVRIFRFHSF